MMIVKFTYLTLCKFVSMYGLYNDDIFDVVTNFVSVFRGLYGAQLYQRGHV